MEEYPLLTLGTALADTFSLCTSVVSEIDLLLFFVLGVVGFENISFAFDLMDARKLVDFKVVVCCTDWYSLIESNRVDGIRVTRTNGAAAFNWADDIDGFRATGT